MKKQTIFPVIIAFLSFCFSYSQSVKVKFDDITNEYKIEKVSSSDNDLSILVTNSKSSSDPKKFKLGANESQSTFVEKVVSNMKDGTSNYFFGISPGLVINVKKEDVKIKPRTYEIIKPDSKEVLSSLLKNLVVWKDKDFNTFLTALEKNVPINVIESLNEFVLEKGEDDLVNLKYGGESIAEVKSIEDVTFEKIFEDFDTLKPNLKSILVPDERFDEIAALNFDEKNKLQLEELYKKIKGNSDYKFIYNAILKDSNDEYIYNINIKNNHKSKYYNLKFCDENYQCKESIKILYSTEKAEFKKIVNSFIKKINSNYEELDEAFMAELYLLVKAHNEKSIIKDAQKPFNKKIDSLVSAIENLATQYSGKLKLNKNVRVYRGKKEAKDTTFTVDYATLRFFNNKAKEVVVVGDLSVNSKEFIVVNYQFSIPLRSFRNTMDFVPISPVDQDAYGLNLNYNDLFKYYPKGEKSNYSARNKSYRIKADSTVVIEERKLMDYFTAVVFSDFLGLNNQNSNSILQAEGRIKVPIWIQNFNYVSFLSSLYADINATIYNGFDDNSRFITPVAVGVDSNNDNMILSATINNFDYIKFNNLNAGLGLDFINFELKGLSTEWSFAYGLRYYRAGLKYTKVEDGIDQVKRYQLNALTHEISTNFEIRPQLNFGADLNLALNWMHGRGASENLNILYNQENDNDKKEVLRLQLNLYSKVNPNESNGGIYARIGGFYHLGAKDFYPQILVGYATNLSSFVNKFTKK